MRLGIPSEIYGSWFELRYAAVVQQALAETGRAGTRVHYIPPAAGSGLRSCFFKLVLYDGQVSSSLISAYLAHVL